jgi:hypothetical protein
MLVFYKFKKMMNEKVFYYLGIGIVTYLATLLYNNIKIKETGSFPVISQILVCKQSFCFYYEKIDSLYSSNHFRYFFLGKRGKILVDKDSTLFILNRYIYHADTILTDIKDKIYLPLSAFPFIVKEEDDFILCRVDSVDKKNGRTKFKLHKVNF